MAPLFASLYASLVVLGYLDGMYQDFQDVEVEALAAGGTFLASAAILTILFVIDGTKGSNRFGDDPRAVSYEGVFD